MKIKVYVDKVAGTEWLTFEVSVRYIYVYSVLQWKYCLMYI